MQHHSLASTQRKPKPFLEIFLCATPKMQAKKNKLPEAVENEQNAKNRCKYEEKDTHKSTKVEIL